MLSRIKSFASIIASDLVYVAHNRLGEFWEVRSMVHGGVLARRASERQANRAAFKFGVGSLRLGKTMAGVHNRNVDSLRSRFIPC